MIDSRILSILKALTFDKVLIIKFVKFCVVGFTGVAVDFGITYLLKEKFKVNKYIANACGFIVAATTNYFLNRSWTFNSQNPHILKEFIHFFIVAILGLVINSIVLWSVNTKLKKGFYFSKLIAIGAATLWNFIANLIFTFAQ